MVGPALTAHIAYTARLGTLTNLSALFTPFRLVFPLGTAHARTT